MRILTVNPLFLITKLSRNVQIFIAISIMACYGLFLYEFLPEYIFNLSLSMYYFVLPFVAIMSVLIVIPRIITKGKSKQSQSTDQSDYASGQSAETVSLGESNQENSTIIGNNAGGIISDIILPSSTASNEITNQIVAQPIVDESVLNDMVAKAMDPIQRETKKMQETVDELKSEISSIKSNIESLTITFETSLTDLKAFQSEIANPLNFMRKYFDTLDIKNLSDPMLPLHTGQLSANAESNSNYEILPTKDSDSQIEHNPVQQPHENPIINTIAKNENIDTDRQGLQDSLQFKHMFNGSFTLGKLMTTITVLEEILQALDKDSIDILIEQCKLMGLRKEDEHVIYNIINMMDESGLSVKEILIMLYKLGKVMGITDNEADLVYAKLMMSQGKSHASLVTVEPKGI